MPYQDVRQLGRPLALEARNGGSNPSALTKLCSLALLTNFKDTLYAVTI